MNKDKGYLAEGFAHVDQAGDPAPFAGCLALLDSLPYYRECKRRSYELLELAHGLSVLDAGCGLGDDAIRMAGLVSPGGLAAGVDESRVMVERAGEKARGLHPAPVFIRADACCLPFAEASFDRARIDRTLQHMKDPESVIRELARVLRPGGLLLAYDNDWGSFSINSGNRPLTRVFTELWCDSFPSGWAGRHLGAWFAAAGLSHVETYPGVSLITDFTVADRVYNLRETVRRAVKQGLASRDDGEAWLTELEEESRQGRFFSSLTAYTVTGKKPA
ncbi:MAG: methyltransferase domain-containing protein [Thermodesulfobacteriota bacterium]